VDKVEGDKLNKIYSFFSVIFVGAIGSGLWDVFLKDIVFNIGGVFVKIFSSIYSGYFDSLYENVGRQIDILLYLPGIVILACVILSPAYAYSKLSFIFSRFKRSLGGDRSKQSKFEKLLIHWALNHGRKFKLLFILPLIIASLAYLNLFIVSSSSMAAVRGVELRLAIIRPYIESQNYYMLMSDFRLVNDRLSLQKLVIKIDTSSTEICDESKLALKRTLNDLKNGLLPSLIAATPSS